MGGRWLYNYSFVGRCFQDWFCIARSNVVQLSFSVFSFVNQLYSFLKDLHIASFDDPSIYT